MTKSIEPAMAKLSPFLVVVASLALLSVVEFFVQTFFEKSLFEAFGTQGGALVQLATSHVPTQEDVDAWEQEKRQIRHDLVNMTGGY